VLWPDADKQGRLMMAKLATKLRAFDAKTLAVVNIEKLADGEPGSGWDAADALDEWQDDPDGFRARLTLAIEPHTSVDAAKRARKLSMLTGDRDADTAALTSLLQFLNPCDRDMRGDRRELRIKVARALKGSWLPDEDRKQRFVEWLTRFRDAPANGDDLPQMRATEDKVDRLWHSLGFVMAVDAGEIIDGLMRDAVRRGWRHPGNVFVIEDGEFAGLFDFCRDLLARERIAYLNGSRLVKVKDDTHKTFRGREVVRPTLYAPSAEEILVDLSRFGTFKVWDGWAKEMKRCNPPLTVARALHGHRNLDLPPLVKVVDRPFLNTDYEIVAKPGWDASGVLYLSGTTTFPDIPARATFDDGLKAMRRLEQLYQTFIYMSEASRSVSLSALLTWIARTALPHSPLHGFSSPAQGAGKTMQVEIPSLIADGSMPSVIPQEEDNVEFDKSVATKLLEGQDVNVGNCTRKFGTGFFSEALTSRYPGKRLLATFAGLTPKQCSP
jgi:hypothetical protein